MSTAIVKDGVIVNIIMASIENAEKNLQRGETAVEAPNGLTLGDAITRTPEAMPDLFDEEVVNLGPAVKAFLAQLESESPGITDRAKARYNESPGR